MKISILIILKNYNFLYNYLISTDLTTPYLPLSLAASTQGKRRYTQTHLKFCIRHKLYI